MSEQNSLILKHNRSNYSQNQKSDTRETNKTYDLAPRQTATIQEYRRTDYFPEKKKLINFYKTQDTRHTHNAKVFLGNSMDIKVKKPIYGVKKILVTRIKENALNLKSEKYEIIGSDLHANSERKFTSLSSKAFRTNNTKREFKPLVNYSLFNTSSKGLDNNENIEFQELKKKGIR